MKQIKIENKAFISFPNDKAGLIFNDINHDKYPIKYYNVLNGNGFKKNEDCSYYGYCYSGSGFAQQEINPPMYLEKGMYFSSSELNCICGVIKIILIEVYHKKGVYPLTNFKAVSLIGGKVEDVGRLKYIDGCTDSLLIPPVKMGDPCLNHLHFPKNIDQTPHTHPSARIGIVSKGNGECITPFGNLPLYEEMIFVIKEWDNASYSKGLDNKKYPDGTHSFKTFNKNGMDVIAFHPDSDFGATDIDQPMINRTIIDGVSANSIDRIRTQ